jgi:hypothetical protein
LNLIGTSFNLIEDIFGQYKFDRFTVELASLKYTHRYMTAMDTTMRALPGSERMVGGPHMCMCLDCCIVCLDGWSCGSVYMHVAYNVARPYNHGDCQAVLSAVHAMNQRPHLAAGVLLRGEHAPGHPLPGVFTVATPAYRVDMRAYPHQDKKNLWAEVYRL